MLEAAPSALASGWLSRSGIEMPDRAHQRQLALEKANRVRFARAALKRVLRTSPDQDAALAVVAAVLVELPPDLAGSRLDRLLLSCPRVGRSRVRVICRRAAIDGSVRISSLMRHERDALLAQLPDPRRVAIDRPTASEVPDARHATAETPVSA